MRMYKRSDMYSTDKGVCAPEITPSKNHDNIRKYEPDEMTQERLHQRIRTK